MSERFASLNVEVVSTVDRVADELRRALFEGELESGTALREIALADSLRVSRSTVREALGHLVAEGLATREPNRGVSVSSPDPDSIHDVCRARAVLEVAGVRCWHDGDESLREAVRQALVDYTSVATSGAPYQQLNELHLAFHHSLVGLAGSPRLNAMAESLYSELKLTLAQVDRMRRNAHAQVDSHALLVELLEKGEIEGAVSELIDHLAGAETAIRTALSL